MCDKTILENGETLKSVPDYFKNKKTCNKAPNTFPSAIQFFPEWYETQEICVEAVDIWPFFI